MAAGAGFTGQDKFNLKSNNFKIAFAVEDYLTYEAKLDPRYVKYVALKSTYQDGRFFNEKLSIHKCTDDDYDSFYEIE